MRKWVRPALPLLFRHYDIEHNTKEDDSPLFFPFLHSEDPMDASGPPAKRE